MSDIVGKINFCVYIGDDFIQELEIKDKDTGLVIDVSGYTFKMQIRSCKDNAIIIHELNSPAGSGIDISNGANGIIILTISKTDTLNFTEQNAVYDIYWTDDSGNIKTFVQGNFQILERITKN